MSGGFVKAARFASVAFVILAAPFIAASLFGWISDLVRLNFWVNIPSLLTMGIWFFALGILMYVK